MHVGLYGRDFLGQTYSLKQLILIWFQTVCLDEMWSERAIPSFSRDLQIGREKKIWMQTESIAKRAITKPIITGVWRRKQFHFFSFLFFSTIYDNSLSVYGILTRYRQFHVCPGRGKRKSKVTKLFLRSFPSDAHWKNKKTNYLTIYTNDQWTILRKRYGRKRVVWKMTQKSWYRFLYSPYSIFSTFLQAFAVEAVCVDEVCRRRRRSFLSPTFCLH